MFLSQNILIFHHELFFFRWQNQTRIIFGFNSLMLIVQAEKNFWVMRLKHATRWRVVLEFIYAEVQRRKKYLYWLGNIFKIVGQTDFLNQFKAFNQHIQDQLKFVLKFKQHSKEIGQNREFIFGSCFYSSFSLQESINGNVSRRQFPFT